MGRQQAEEPRTAVDERRTFYVKAPSQEIQGRPGQHAEDYAKDSLEMANSDPRAQANSARISDSEKPL